MKTVSAYENVSLTAEKGKITVSGKTSAETGNATILAGNETYVAGEAGTNIIIDHYGEVKAGNDATMIVVNGDLHVTDKIIAGRNYNTETLGQGSIFIDKEITVVQDMSMKTENGSIIVGKESGDGKLTTGGDVKIETKNGNATVNTSITSTGGSVSMDLDHGNIKVGEVKTENAILAKNDVSLKVADGTITVNGTTKTQEGSITVEALDDAKNGTAAKNIVITHDGKLDSGLDLTLHTSNGGIDVTDDTLAKQNLTVTVDNEGDVKFERNVDVTGNVVAKTGTGNITIGKTITTGNDVSMTVGEGDILVGEDVTAGGKVKLDVTEKGNVTVGEADGTGKITAAGAVDIATKNGGTTVKTSITSTGDSVSVKAEQGNIYVGEVDTSKAILAKENINLNVTDGTITVNGTTKTQDGDITVEALNDKNDKNIVITENGMLDSGRDLTLHTTNGSIDVTGNTLAKEDLTVTIDKVGDVNFERNVDVTGNVVAKTGTGNIKIGKTITTGKDVTMTAGTGDILVGEDVTAGGKVKLDVTEKGNVTVGETDGTGKITAAGAVDIATKNGGTTVKTSITSTGDSVSVKA